MRRALVLVAAGCGATMGRERPATEPLLPLALDQPASGDTHDDDGWHMAICIGGGIAGQTSARGYRFVAPETGSYRFELEAGYDAVVEITDTENEQRGTVSCFGVGHGQRGGVTAALRGGTAYDVVVDGALQARGRYTLAVRRDDGASAPVRSEDPAVTGPACAAAPALVIDGDAAGTFRSVPGGLRASCGGTGGATAYRLAVPEGGARLELAAHFAPVVEVRRGCDGAPVTCVAASTGAFDVAVDALPAGDYIVVIDTSQVIADPPDDRPGAGVLGAYWLRAVRR